MLIMLSRKEEAQKHGRYAKTSRPKSICIYLLIIHLDISIQNISLVLSCESHPKCKLKATNNCTVDDEGVTPRLLWVSLPGVPEDRRPTKMPPGPSLGPLVAPT